LLSQGSPQQAPFSLFKNETLKVCISSFLVGGLEHFFPYIGNNHPNSPIFFRGIETTNQLSNVPPAFWIC
jgi:hypothetical protein